MTGLTYNEAGFACNGWESLERIPSMQSFHILPPPVFSPARLWVCAGHEL